MNRLVVAVLLIVGGITLSSCSEPTDGVKRPEVVTPPPERLEVHAATPGGENEPSPMNE